MGLFMIFMLTPWFQEVGALPWGEAILRVVGAVLGFVNAFAALFILFGMVVFCACEDHSPISDKVLWFLLFFVTACFGAVVYFFVVYRRLVRPTAQPPSVQNLR